MNQKPEHLVALDAGNSMTRVLVAEMPPGMSNDPPALRFLGFGQSPSQGWHKGTLADIEAAAASIRNAADQAQKQAGSVVEKAMLGIGGTHLQGISSRAAVRLGARPREVRREDVHRVLEEARDFRLGPDREILHLAPKEFVLDSQEGVRNPAGMMGLYLEARVHVVTHSASAAQNLVTAANRASVLVEALAGEAYVCGECIPSAEERELGVLVAVVGGPSTSLLAYDHSGLCLAGELPIGGDHFTGDMAIGLRTSRADAETIKKTFGSVFPGWRHEGASVEVPGMGNQPSRQIPYRLLRDILEPRARELFLLAAEEMRRSGLQRRLSGGIVLAGGGARLAGMCDLAEKVLDLPARIGLPPAIAGLPEELDSPEYSALLSLLQYGARVRQQRTPRNGPPASRLRHLLAWSSKSGNQ